MNNFFPGPRIYQEVKFTDKECTRKRRTVSISVLANKWAGKTGLEGHAAGAPLPSLKGGSWTRRQGQGKAVVQILSEGQRDHPTAIRREPRGEDRIWI